TNLDLLPVIVRKIYLRASRGAQLITGIGSERHDDGLGPLNGTIIARSDDHVHRGCKSRNDGGERNGIEVTRAIRSGAHRGGAGEGEIHRDGLIRGELATDREGSG